MWGKDNPDINHSPKPLQYTLALKVSNSISDQGCSLDELVSKVRDLFASEGLPGFVVLLLRLIDESVNVGIKLLGNCFSSMGSDSPHC